MKTAEMSGAALDWAVAKIEQPQWTEEDLWWNTIGYVDTGDADDEPYHPSTDWAQGGPIIEREYMYLEYSGIWRAYCTQNGNSFLSVGSTPLIAAMRCYVASKLGDEVELPEELEVTA